MSASILLFYSNRCPHSKQFLKECQAHHITSFHKICIDSTPRERIPAIVKSVPALVFAGSNQCLQSEQTFQWLNQQIQEQQQKRQQQQQAQQAGLAGNGVSSGVSTGGGGTGEPSAWQSTEMGASFSDTYSFLDNSFTESGAGLPLKENTGGSGSTIPKNFAFLDDGATFQSSNAHNPSASSNAHNQTPSMSQGQNVPTNVPTNMRGLQSAQHPQQPRNGAPSGFGTMPPTASMAPPTNRPETDELSKRMESFRMSREEDVPQHMQRIS